MDEKEKEKKRNRNWVVFLLLAGALAAAARPSIRFFEALIADGEPTAMTFTAAAIICGLIAIVLLSAIAGLLSMVHWPVIGTAVLIFLITAACGAALYNSVQNMPAPAEKRPEHRGRPLRPLRLKLLPWNGKTVILKPAQFFTDVTETSGAA